MTKQDGKITLDFNGTDPAIDRADQLAGRLCRWCVPDQMDRADSAQPRRYAGTCR